MTLKRATTLKQQKELLQSVSAALSEVKPRPWHPHFYQKKFVRFLLENGCAAGWLDPGLGKTSCVLAAFKILLKEGMAEKMLVVAPRRVCRLVWPKETQKWIDFHGLRMVLLHGSKKDQALEEDADIYLINPEGLPWLMKNGRFKKLKADILCVDESSKFKHTNTQRFKLMRPVLGTFARRWTLTGTPSPNGYMDVFGQIYLTDMGAALGQYITHYRNNYFNSTGYGGYTWIIKDDGEKRIQQRLKPVVMRLDAKDYLKLPKETPILVEVELPDDVRKIYDDMEKEMIVELEGTKITALSVAAATNKCAQIANGGLYKQAEMDSRGLTIRGKREWIDLHDEKTDAVENILEELGGKPALIAYDFEHDLSRLVKRLGKDAPRMGISDKRDAQLEAMWNRGELPFLLGHPASIGHGLNLQEAGHDVIWHSLTWDFENYDQFIKRVLRQGNKSSFVRVHHIVARGTVDEMKMRAMTRKDVSQRGLLDALKTYVRSRHKVAA